VLPDDSRSVSMSVPFDRVAVLFKPLTPVGDSCDSSVLVSSARETDESNAVFSVFISPSLEVLAID
jgi:hypothetical protein